MMTDRKKSLMRVQTYGFALDEAVLFLDTHPDDQAALNYFHEALKLYNTAVADYVKNYGPLETAHVKSNNSWTWAKDCMPWEVDCNVEI